MGLRDECGVAAAYSKNPVENPKLVYSMLISMQNRGDLSSGIASYLDKKEGSLIRRRIGLGKVVEFFGDKDTRKFYDRMNYLQGNASIGHVRYATSDNSKSSEDTNRIRAQPYLQEHDQRYKYFAFAFNGNLTNFDELMSNIRGEKDNYHLKTKTDTELIKIHLSRELHHIDRVPSIDDFVNVFSNVAEKFDGAYSLTYIDGNGNMIVARDPNGFKPLSYHGNGDAFFAASESTALKKIGIENYLHLEPGTMMVITPQGINGPFKFAESNHKSLCMFEYIYFANATSNLDGIFVQNARQDLGYKLAMRETLDINENFVIAPIPETPRPAVHGYLRGLHNRNMGGLTGEILIKSSNSRTFTTNGASKRQERMNDKFDITKDIVKGKEVILIDDSIVRGTTSHKVVHDIKNIGGASKVHLRIMAPRNAYPCFYGIDMPSQEDLMAAKFSTEEICEKIGADSLIYNSIEDAIDSCGKSGLCDSCFSGCYPTEGGRMLFDRSLIEGAVLHKT